MPWRRVSWPPGGRKWGRGGGSDSPRRYLGRVGEGGLADEQVGVEGLVGQVAVPEEQDVDPHDGDTGATRGSDGGAIHRADDEVGADEQAGEVVLERRAGRVETMDPVEDVIRGGEFVGGAVAGGGGAVAGLAQVGG